MTHLELVDALVEAGFRIALARPERSGLVVADRPIPGMPRCFRVCGASRIGDGSWTVRVRVTEPGLGLSRVERDVRELAGVTDRDAFEFWLGGVCSIPAGDAERFAIGPSAPGIRRLVAWTAGHGWTEWHVLAEFCAGVDRNHYRTVCGLTEPHAPFARDQYREACVTLRPLGTCRSCWPQDESRVGEPVTATAAA